MSGDATPWMLVLAAAGAGVFHTLIPDHWLPFVLIGRARSWSGAHTALVSGLSATVHVVVSIVIGGMALGIGATAAAAVGESLERAGSVLLLLFGLAYAGWAWHKGGHFHPGGAWLHGDDGCAGEEGDANPEHLHYHADEELIGARARWSGWGLALLVGINPCVLLMPMMITAATRGSRALLLVTVGYGVPALLLTVTLSSLGVTGARRVRLPGAARHMEMASGLLIAALGAAYWIFEH